MIPRYTRKEMAQIWTDESRFKIWLEIETYALEAMVAKGLAPQSALDAVIKQAKFDVARINELERELKHDVIAFLTNVSESVGESSRYLHLGLTSSDVLDTCLSVQLTQATDLIITGVKALLESIKQRALEHKLTPCIGRSHGIHAEPTTFGLKLALYYAELQRHLVRLKAAREDIAVGAVSGPVGTFAHLGTYVEAHVCKRLGLKPEPVSTQVIQRDHHARIFNAYAEVGATLEKLAIEVRHLQRTEVREAEEPFTVGQKGSSAMPHKRNPVLSENVTGLARLLRHWAGAALENVALWHERDISHSSVERVIGPDATITLDFMLHRMRSVIDGLVVYPENMQRNLDLTKGLYYSAQLLVELAAAGTSRDEAYRKVQAISMQLWDELSSATERSKVKSLAERIQAEKFFVDKLGSEKLAQIFSLDSYTEYVDEIFRRVFN